MDKPVMLMTALGASTPFLARYLVLRRYEENLLVALEQASKLRTEEDFQAARELGDRIKECHTLMRSSMDEHMSCIARRIGG